MSEIAVAVDWAFFPKVNGRDIIYYGKRGESGVMCAGMSMCDAVIIADTAEELVELATKYKSNTMHVMDEEVIEGITPQPITWQTLTTEWRWVIYKGKARFVIGGNDFCATAITNTPSRESAITCDPTTVIFVGATEDFEYISHDGCVIVGQDVPDLLIQLAAIKGDQYEMRHIVCIPLMTLAKDNIDVWYNRSRHSVREALEKNPVLLLGSFSDLSLEQISENSELIAEKIKSLTAEDAEENKNEN